jgi:hypothetical protein
MLMRTSGPQTLYQYNQKEIVLLGMGEDGGPGIQPIAR